MNKFIFATMLALGLASSAIHASTLTFSLQPNQRDFHINDSFNVDLIASGIPGEVDDQLLGFGLNFAVSDSTVLQLNGYTLNSLFDDLALGSPDVTGFAFPVIGSNLWSGQALTLMTFHLQALSVGQAQLSVSSLADAEQNQGLVFLNQPALAIDAEQNFTVSSVPLPSATLLFLSGFGILAKRSSRKVMQRQ